MGIRVRGLFRAGVRPVIGVARLAGLGQARWRPVFLLAGVLLMVIGWVLSAITVLVVGLILLGSAATAERSRAGLLTPTAAMVRSWMPQKRPDHLKRLPAESLPRHFGCP
jgi:hypothetical protein